MNPAWRDPVGILNGARNLADQCNGRLIPHARDGTEYWDSPGGVFNCLLRYAAESAIAAAILVERGVRGGLVLALSRAVLESSSRALWGSRTEERWQRYRAYLSKQQVKYLDSMEPWLPREPTDTQRGQIAELKQFASIEAMPERIDVVVREVFNDEDRDLASHGVVEERMQMMLSPRGFYDFAFRGVLHPSAHGHPVVMSWDERRDDLLLSMIHALASVNLVRAVHIHLGWPQQGAYDAWTWIVRGDRSEEPPPADGYGDCGLGPVC